MGQDFDVGDDVWQEETPGNGHYTWEWCGPEE